MSSICYKSPDVCRLVANMHLGGIAQVVGLLAHVAVVGRGRSIVTAIERGLDHGLEEGP